jgi:hypothetical protein
MLERRLHEVMLERIVEYQYYPSNRLPVFEGVGLLRYYYMQN